MCAALEIFGMVFERWKWSHSRNVLLCCCAVVQPSHVVCVCFSTSAVYVSFRPSHIYSDYSNLVMSFRDSCVLCVEKTENKMMKKFSAILWPMAHFSFVNNAPHTFALTLAFARYQIYLIANSASAVLVSQCSLLNRCFYISVYPLIRNSFPFCFWNNTLSVIYFLFLRHLSHYFGGACVCACAACTLFTVVSCIAIMHTHTEKTP